MSDIIKILNNNQLLGMIIKSANRSEGINFLTDSSSSLQLACMHHKKGYNIQPHIHNIIDRKINNTQEVILIKKGKVKVNFFQNNQVLFESHILSDGDIVFLEEGGHGFEILEETEMFEVKQGPYAGENDKTRFEPKVKKENEKY